ncbi:hypothetical protein ES703_81179 [subsurface metagenome]
MGIRFLQGVKVAQTYKRTRNKLYRLANMRKIINDSNGIGIADKINRFCKLEAIELVIEMDACILVKAFYVGKTLGYEFFVKLKGRKIKYLPIRYYHLHAICQGHYPVGGWIERADKQAVIPSGIAADDR